MILFQPTRTQRISVRLAELTLGQAIAVCKLPAERSELTITELLRFAAAAAEKPLPRFVTDPRLWTVEERTLLVCNYLAHVTADGPDFSVGEGGKLSDYVMFDRDLYQEHTDLGDVAGTRMLLRPLLGVHVQVLETIAKTRGEWIIGAIACQVSAASEAAVDWSAMSEVAMLEWVQQRMEAVRALPESAFEAVFAAFWAGRDILTHFFRTDFDDAGVMFMPVEKEGVGPQAPARFRAAACVSDIARSLSGGPDQPSR